MTTQLVLGGTTNVTAPTPTTYIVVATGTLDVGSGGSVTGATAAGTGSFVVIEAGGTDNNTTIVGGTEFDYGTSNGTVIANGGVQHVFGGTANNVTIAAGAYQDVLNGTVNGSTLAGYRQVDTGGVTYATVIVSGGDEFVANGGTTNGTVITANGLQYVNVGGTADGTEIDNGGNQYVAGTSNDAVVNAGGTQDVAGTANSTTVNSGGVQHVVTDGTAVTTTVQAGGFQQVNNGAVQGSEVSGNLQVLTGTSANTVVLAGGNEYIGNGASASGTTVNAAGLQYVDAGGSATSTTVNGGFVFVAGTATGTTVNSGELDLVGTASGTHLAGGSEHVIGGGVQQNVDFAGAASSLYLDNPSGLTGTISNFEVGDVIDFRNLSVSSFTFDGATLTLATGGGNLNYQFAGVEANTALNVASDGNGGTSVSLSLLSQASASLVPDAGEGTITPSGTDPSSSSLVHAAT